MASLPGTGDFVGSMYYLLHEEGDDFPYGYMYKREDGGPQRHGTRVWIDMKITDARPDLPEMSLDKNGICLLPTQTALSHQDFYHNEEKIRTVYYKEMEELVRRATGASRVVVFDHNVRNSELHVDPAELAKGAERKQRQEKGGPVVTAPVVLCHNDYTNTSAPQRVRDLAKPSGEGGSYTLTNEPLVREAEVPALLGNRYIFINVWRNISDTPIQRDPLAVCDWTSIQEKHFIDSALIYRDRVGYTQGVKYDPNHRWIYFGRMRKDEAMLLKCFDSKPGVAKWTAHTAVADPSTPSTAPPRESIEARCIVFFAPTDTETTGARLASLNSGWAKL